MKEEFMDYLASIGMPEALWHRVREIYNFYRDVCPDEITDIFVSEYVKDDGSREYENLWFFSKKACMEAKQFITNDDFDMCQMENRVIGWRVKKKDYDFKRSTDKSRVSLVFRFDYAMEGELKASRGNCDCLRQVLLKHVLPSLKDDSCVA